MRHLILILLDYGSKSWKVGGDMLAFLNRYFSIIVIVILVILIALPVVVLYERRPDPIAVINFGQRHGSNYIYIRSYNDEIMRNLQLRTDKGSQSYLKTDDYLYTYGETGFVYIDLHTADVFIVLRDDLNDEVYPHYDEYLRSYYHIDDTKVEATAPRIHIINEDELDADKHRIMEALKVVKIPFPLGHDRIYIPSEK